MYIYTFLKNCTCINYCLFIKIDQTYTVVMSSIII